MQRPLLLKQILDARAPPLSMDCCKCGSHSATLRCISCMGTPVYCTTCMLSAHERLPFHQTELWNGEYFAPKTLHSLGYTFHLCQKVNKCSLANTYPKSSEPMPGSTNSLPDDSNAPSILEMTIISSSGIHSVWVANCKCSRTKPYSQLLAARLFPATTLKPKSAFTFEVLDHFLVDSTVCKTTAFSFYEKLRHLTNPVNPASLPVCRHLSTIFQLSSFTLSGPV